MSATTINQLRHPDLIDDDAFLWEEWRDTFAGGERYRDQYLRKFSDKETDTEFEARRTISPIPTFAKAAVLDIRNAIFQRLEAVTRIGGSSAYQRAASGEGTGVDRKGSSMNHFMGVQVLTELLAMGRVGTYVDAPAVVPSTMAETPESPWVYTYRIEDILNYCPEDPERPGQFKAVLLRDYALEYNRAAFPGIELPVKRTTRYRLLWRDEAGDIRIKFVDEGLNPIGEEQVLEGLTEIPFYMPSIGESLLKDVNSYQKALLQILSRAVTYDLDSNFPFLAIQKELRSAAAHLREPGQDATPGNQRAADKEERLGSGKGIFYDRELNAPQFIAPPTETLLASLKLQEKLEDDIRRLVNLAVENKVGSRTESAEAKKISSQGLEAGLSYIGLELQKTEQQIARYWAMYENSKKPNVAKIAYPKRYILKEDSDRISEAKELLELMRELPGSKIKKLISQQIVHALVEGKETTDVVMSLINEIERAGYTTSDPEVIFAAQKAGLVGDELASEALGFRDGEVEKAADDHAERAVRILRAQTSIGGGVAPNAAARGVPELDDDLNSGEEERE